MSYPLVFSKKEIPCWKTVLSPKCRHFGCCYSVIQLLPTLDDPMDNSLPVAVSLSLCKFMFVIFMIVSGQPLPASFSIVIFGPVLSHLISCQPLFQMPSLFLIFRDFLLTSLKYLNFTFIFNVASEFSDFISSIIEWFIPFETQSIVNSFLQLKSIHFPSAGPTYIAIYWETMVLTILIFIDFAF